MGATALAPAAWARSVRIGVVSRCVTYRGGAAVKLEVEGGPSRVTATAAGCIPERTETWPCSSVPLAAGSSRVFGWGAESRGPWRRCISPGTASGCDPPSGQTLVATTPAILTGVEFEEELDGVIIEVAAVQDDLDQRGQAALPGCRHRHGAGHVQRVEH